MKRQLSVVVLFCFCFLAGYSLLRQNTEDSSIMRDPAAVRNNFDFSNLNGDKLQSAIKQRILGGFEFRKNPNGTGIGLGHFVFLDSTGQKKSGCQEYENLSLVFEADGVSVAGEKPEMVIEGYCESSQERGKIDPLMLPIAKILGERPGDGEFQFNEGSPLNVKFTNLPDEWPKTWLLKSVTLLNKKTSQTFRIESEEVAHYLGHPIVLSF
jgi:hypothetical protein